LEETLSTLPKKISENEYCSAQIGMGKWQILYCQKNTGALLA